MAKELIDLGNGQPNSGDTLPAGGEKINNLINAVYDSFSRKGLPPEEQILQATGVYQYVSYDNVTAVDSHFEYQAKVGEMLIVDMEGEVHIILPELSWAGSQIQVCTSALASPPTVRVYSASGQVNGQDYVILEPYIQYQFISSLDPVDGQWSQRVIDGSGNNEVSWEKHTNDVRGASLCVKIPRSTAIAGRLSLLDSSVIPGEVYSDLRGTTADISFITAGNTTKTTVVETNVTAAPRLDTIPEVQYALTAYADDYDNIFCVTPILSANIDHVFLVKQKSLDIIGNTFNDVEKATQGVQFYAVDEVGDIYFATGTNQLISSPFPAIDVVSCPITGDLYALLFNGTRHCIYRKAYSPDPTPATDTSWELVYEPIATPTTIGGGLVIGHNGILFSYINCDDGSMQCHTYYPEHITLGVGVIETIYTDGDAIGKDICLTQENTPFILFSRSGEQPASYWVTPVEGSAGSFPDTYFATCCTLHKGSLYIGCAGRDGGSLVLVGTSQPSTWPELGTFSVLGAQYDTIDIAGINDTIYVSGRWDIDPSGIHAFATFDLTNPTADWVVTYAYESTAVINSIQPVRGGNASGNAIGVYGFGKDIFGVGFSSADIVSNTGVFSFYGNAVIKITRAYIINSLYVAP